jgi:hypothetical protein
MVVVFSLGAACCYALASVLQQSAAADVPAEHSMRIGLLTRLARRPLWLLGFVTDFGGFGFEAAALSIGSLALVQPLIVLGLPLAMLAVALSSHRHLNVGEWGAIAAVTIGIAIFLSVSVPSRGRSHGPVNRWTVVGVFCAVALIGVLAVAEARPAVKTTLFAVATGIVHGVSAALTKTVASIFHDHPAHVLGHWETYALVVVGAGSMLLAQSAFQAGHLKASLPAITLLPPVVGLAIGAYVFNERIHAGPVGWTLDAIGAAMAVAGVFALARSHLAEVAYVHGEDVPS